jgi:hypothetical protein
VEPLVVFAAQARAQNVVAVRLVAVALAQNALAVVRPVRPVAAAQNGELVLLVALERNVLPAVLLVVLAHELVWVLIAAVVAHRQLDEPLH